MIEILVVCSALMCSNEDLVAYGVPMGPHQQFDSSAIGGSWLHPFCFINGPRSGYIRVIEWTDRVVRVEASEGIRRCGSGKMV